MTSRPGPIVSSAFSIVAVRAASVAASPFDAVQGPLDLGLLLVQAADERVELVERVRDFGLAALQGLAELVVDGLQLGETAAVEHQRQGAEHLLDLHVPVGALQRDQRAVLQAARRLLVAGRGQLDELLAQQARSAGCRRPRWPAARRRR